MRELRVVLVVFLVLSVAVVVSAGKSEEKLMKEVTAIGDSISKAMVEDDFEFLLGLYTEDAISLPNYGPRMEGLDTFREHHEQMAGSGMKVTSFESAPTEAWECGKQVIAIGTFTIALEMPGMPKPIQIPRMKATSAPPILAMRMGSSIKAPYESGPADVEILA